LAPVPDGCYGVAVPRAALLAAVLALSGLAAGTAGGATPAQPKTCLITATGALGGNRDGNVTRGQGVAGGLAQPGGAKASVSVLCNFLSGTVKIRVPSHSIAIKSFVHALPGACTQAGDTVTCKLDTRLQKTGLSYGGWKDSFAWKFTPDDPTSHNVVDGSCHVPLTVTLLNGSAVTYTKKTQTVCEFSLGDALQ